MTSTNTVDLFLAHYGVKGMKWGVRKDKTLSSHGKNWSIAENGEVTINKGAVISRVVRNHKGLFGGTGHTLDSGRPVYAAFKPVDIASYEHGFGRSKSLFVKEASSIIKFTPKDKITTPGPAEAAKLYFDTIKSDPAAQEALYGAAQQGWTKKRLDRALIDPTTTEAYNLYTYAIDSGNFEAALQPVNEKYFKAVKKAGYNALVDPADASWAFDTPIMILDGKKSLDVKAQYLVDKVSAKNARLAYKEESKKVKTGKTYLDQLGYFD